MFNFLFLGESIWDKPSAFGLPLGVVMLVFWAVMMRKQDQNSETHNKILNDRKLVSAKGAEVYYSSNIEKRIAEKFSDSVSDWEHGAFHIDKENNTYLLRTVMKEGLWLDQEWIDRAKHFAKECRDTVFNGQSLDLHLCNDKMESKRVIINDQSESTDFIPGKEITGPNKNTLYYTSNVELSTAQKILKVLADDGANDNVFRIDKEKDTYILRFGMIDGGWDQETIDHFESRIGSYQKMALNLLH